MQPVIGIAWPKPDYLKAIERAGGSARVLRPDDDPLPQALDECDGVLLTGGADVDPARYGERHRHKSVEVDAARDDYEFALTRAALDRDLPLLAICRGVQLLNVVAGGTLVQDIPAHLTTPLVHRRPRPPKVKKAPAHDIRMAPHTRLRSILDHAAHGTGHLTVNSRHHQSVQDVAPGFIVSATAPDGVVEAIEKPSATFCVGVQWHPENYWRTGEFSELFEALVAASSVRRQSRETERSRAAGRRHRPVEG